MDQLILRAIEAGMMARLERRAASHGQSMAAEARDILRAALMSDDACARGLGTRIAERFRGIGLKPQEQIQELRGEMPRDPFEE